MTASRIEHVNVTVSDPERAAALMQSVFGWKVRWSGPARDGGERDGRKDRSREKKSKKRKSGKRSRRSAIFHIYTL